MSDFNLLNELYELIKTRRNGNADESYVAKLFKRGRSKIAQKIGEEATELVIEAIEDKKKAAISESADLLFHIMVLWVDMGIKPEKVLEELASRRKVSGIEEKKNRKNKD